MSMSAETRPAGLRWSVARIPVWIIPLLVGVCAFSFALHSYLACSLPSSGELDKIRRHFATLKGVKDPSSVAIAVQALQGDRCLQKITLRDQDGRILTSMVRSAKLKYLFTEAVDPRQLDASTRKGVEQVQEPPVVDMKPLIKNPTAESGAVDSPNTIVEFSDFQCPFCKKMATTLMQQVINQQNGTRIHFVFRNYPLSFHSHARQEAELAACTAKYSPASFWGLHDFLFSAADLDDNNVLIRGNEFLRKAAAKNISSIDGCVRTRAVKPLVDQDIALGSTYGVTGTPTLFVNGHQITGARDAAAIRKYLTN